MRHSRKFVRTILGCLVAMGAGLGMEFAAAQATPPAGNGAGVQAPPRPPSSQPAPIIHVDNVEHDFGDVWVGPEVEHTFVVYNRGTANLEIRGVSVTCGCMTTNDYPRVIEPGKSGNFGFKLRTIGLNGRIAPKQATITSNDPVTPQLVLRLLGTFKKRIDVVPAAASFGTLITTDPMERLIKITNNTDKPLQLKLSPFISESFKVELTETGPGKVFDLKVATVTPYKPGILQSMIELQTNLDEEQVIKVPVSARVPDRLDLYPPLANYVRPARLMPGQTSGSLYFWLNNYGASLVNVKGATVDDPAIKATVEARAPGKNYRIQVDVPMNITVPPTGRTLTIQTDDPDKPTLQAKIVGANIQAQTEQNQQPNTPPQQNPAEAMIGQPVPSFKLTTFDNRSLATEDLKDKLTVLNFVSPICGFCKKQIPDLEKIRQTYQDKGVRFVNVFNTNPTRQRPYTDAEITEISTSLGSKIELAGDPEMAVGSLFKARGYPTCVLIGKDSKVAAVNVGSNRIQNLPAQLDALLAGKPIPNPPSPPPTPPQQNPAETMIGQPAPSFKLTTFDSRSLATGDLKDKLTVLNFVSPICGFCKKQIPELEKIRQAYQDKGVRFVNVFNTNPTGRRPYTDAEITEITKSLGSNLETVGDTGMTTGAAFRVRSYPTCMLIGKDSKVAAVNIGSNRIQNLPAQLDALLAGKPIAPATQPH